MKILRGFRIAENPDTEIGIIRNYEFRKAYAMLIYNLNDLDISKLMKQYNEAIEIDKQVIFNNFMQSCLVHEKNYNAYLECFKLICLEEIEDIHDLDNLYLNQKLKRISEAGFTSQEIESEVENFSNKLPASRNLKINKLLAIQSLRKLTKK